MSAKSKFFSVIRFAILVAIAAGAFYGIEHYLGNGNRKVYESPVKTVYTAKPQKRVIADTIEISSYIEAEAMVPSVPFVSGTIMEYNIEAGQHVDKDQVIAVIDPASYELRRSQAEAAYLGYDSAYRRLENLSGTGAISKQEFDTAKAQRDAAKAQLELAELQLSYTKVKAAQAGTVLKAPANKGMVASTSTPIAIIADLDDLVVNIKVSESYFGKVMENKDNLKVRVTRPASTSSSEAVADAEIVSISPFVDATTKTFAIKARLSSNASAFRPGMYVKSQLILSEKECYAMPATTKKLDGSVYYYDEATQTAVYVKLPELASDDDYFEVEDKYRNTYFITKGQSDLLSGEHVNAEVKQ